VQSEDPLHSQLCQKYQDVAQKLGIQAGCFNKPKTTICGQCCQNPQKDGRFELYSEINGGL